MERVLPLCPHLLGDPGPELLAVEQSVRKAEPEDLNSNYHCWRGRR